MAEDYKLIEVVGEVINKVITRISKEVVKLDKKITELTEEKNACLYYIKKYSSMDNDSK
jgi:hypothetical protein